MPIINSHVIFLGICVLIYIWIVTFCWRTKIYSGINGKLYEKVNVLGLVSMLLLQVKNIWKKIPHNFLPFPEVNNFIYVLFDNFFLTYQFITSLF